ncbi:MAG: metallophosphoesterase [Candidatus Thermoplasmatota archaeon]|nr:metallophosphoesterase [Candidatus Thermoplasmatota archaeon]MCG2826022.1 metallophosphoesterase [Thermoplasmatales archaeon]
MNDIIAVADIHEGINFGFNMDVETGISERAIDIHKNLVKAAEFAIDNHSKLFVIAGDLFDRTHISPTYREMIRKDVIEPLGKNNVGIWILAGNHDQPHSSKKGTSIDDFRGYPHVSVYRGPSVEEIVIDNKKVRCLIMPYMHPDSIALIVKEKIGKDVPPEQMFTAGQKLIKNWLKEKSEPDADYKILFAHYYVEGAKIRETTYPEILPGEFSFTKDMIPDNLDIAVFGHIHLHQSMGKIGNTEVVYTGAVERIDWGEREDPKGFISLSVKEKKWDFVKLPVRDMIKINVDIKPDEEPNERILKSIPDASRKMIRLEITLPEGFRARVSDDKINEKLKNAFYYDIRWIETTKEKIGLISFTTNPYELLKEFIELNYADDRRKDEILNEGNNILKEVLE